MQRHSPHSAKCCAPRQETEKNNSSLPVIHFEGKKGAARLIPGDNSSYNTRKSSAGYCLYPVALSRGAGGESRKSWKNAGFLNQSTSVGNFRSIRPHRGAAGSYMARRRRRPRFRARGADSGARTPAPPRGDSITRRRPRLRELFPFMCARLLRWQVRK